MKFLVLVCMLLSVPALADKHEESFADAKANALKFIDKRIEHLQSAKGCISAAANKEAVKACREQLKNSNSQLRDMRKESRSRRQNLRKDMKGKKQ